MLSASTCIREIGICPYLVIACPIGSPHSSHLFGSGIDPPFVVGRSKIHASASLGPGLATAAPPRLVPEGAEADHENAEHEQHGDADDEEDAEREEPEPEVAAEHRRGGYHAAATHEEPATAPRRAG